MPRKRRSNPCASLLDSLVPELGSVRTKLSEPVLRHRRSKWTPPQTMVSLSRPQYICLGSTFLVAGFMKL